MDLQQPINIFMFKTPDETRFVPKVPHKSLESGNAPGCWAGKISTEFFRGVPYIRPVRCKIVAAGSQGTVLCRSLRAKQGVTLILELDSLCLSDTNPLFQEFLIGPLYGDL